MTHATDDEFDLAALLPSLSRLDNRLSRLHARIEQMGPADPDLADLAGPLRALDVRMARTAAACNQLSRQLERNTLAQSDPNDPRLKRRLPAICKTMTGPREGAQFLRGAAAAAAIGPNTLRRFCAQQREAGLLD